MVPAGAARGRVAPRHDVQHAVDGLVVEDLVERPEPGGGVLARHDPEAVAAQPRVATGTTLHHGRADVRPTADSALARRESRSARRVLPTPVMPVTATVG